VRMRMEVSKIAEQLLMCARQWPKAELMSQKTVFQKSDTDMAQRLRDRLANLLLTVLRPPTTFDELKQLIEDHEGEFSSVGLTSADVRIFASRFDVKTSEPFYVQKTGRIDEPAMDDVYSVCDPKTFLHASPGKIPINIISLRNWFAYDSNLNLFTSLIMDTISLLPESRPNPSGELRHLLVIDEYRMLTEKETKYALNAPGSVETKLKSFILTGRAKGIGVLLASQNLGHFPPDMRNTVQSLFIGDLAANESRLLPKASKITLPAKRDRYTWVVKTPSVKESWTCRFRLCYAQHEGTAELEWNDAGEKSESFGHWKRLYLASKDEPLAIRLRSYLPN